MGLPAESGQSCCVDITNHMASKPVKFNFDDGGIKKSRQCVYDFPLVLLEHLARVLVVTQACEFRNA